MTTPAQLDLILRRLISFRVPKELWLLVLMTSWTAYIDLAPAEPYDLIEFFGGRCKIARLATRQGWKAAAVDLKYDQALQTPCMSRAGKSSPFDINSDSGFVLCIALILQGKWTQLCCIFATQCSSFVQINGMSGRSLLTPEGREDLPRVSYANKMLARTLLLMVVAVATGGSVVLENPVSSYIFETKYFREYVQMLKRAGLPTYKIHLWMKHFGHANPKRTVIISDRKIFGRLDRGVLKNRKAAYATSYRYIDKSGKRRFVGIQPNLQKTGEYPAGFARALLSLLPQLQAQEVRIPIDRDLPLQELCGQLVFNECLWEVAGLGEVVRYLRGGKRLVIPEQWRGCIPPWI